MTAVERAGVRELAGGRSLGDALDPAFFEVRGWEATTSGLVLRGTLRASPDEVRRHVSETAAAVLGGEPLVLLREDSEGAVVLLVTDAAREEASLGSVPRQRPLLSLGLALAALVTTTFAGAAHQGVDLIRDPGAWTVGLPYGLGLMLVLGVHEMGHYLMARRHGIRASLPYFIPVPFALGTFGAFISLPALVRTRRQLFDVGVAGPLAGLAVAVPALALGLRWSAVLPYDPSATVHQGMSVNASMMLALVARLSIGGEVAQGHYLVLHPLAFAGWLGLMVTALNLLPVGQLDGGHVAHALLGRARADWIGKAALIGMVALGLFVWSGLLLWALLVYLVAGRRGEPPQDDLTPLDGKRRVLAWASFALLALILLPLPHALSPALGLHCPYL
ncbi:MAG TPA: site-2 protease family protein [Anaeromyxobacteraceae bacterium]|nr:site-2 protease family protein [Anaeromyxobacteraceae bacterium]